MTNPPMPPKRVRSFPKLMKMGSFSKKASFSKKPLTNTVVNALAVESTPATDVNLESLAKPEEPKPAMRSTTPRETEAATKVQSKVRGGKAKAEVAAMKKAAAAQKHAEVEAMTIITSLSDELLMSEKAKRAGAWPASPPRRALWLVLLVGLLLTILPHILLTYTAAYGHRSNAALVHVQTSVDLPVPAEVLPAPADTGLKQPMQTLKRKHLAPYLAPVLGATVHLARELLHNSYQAVGRLKGLAQREVRKLRFHAGRLLKTNAVEKRAPSEQDTPLASTVLSPKFLQGLFSQISSE